MTTKQNHTASQRWHQLFIGAPHGRPPRQSTPWSRLLTVPGTLVAGRAQAAYQQIESAPDHLWATTEEAYAWTGSTLPDLDHLVEIVVSEGLDSICLARLYPDDGAAWTMFVTHESSARFLFKTARTTLSARE